MPSTFSPSLKIELIANGEQAGTWGQTTNNNLGTLIEQAIAGVDTIDITGVSTYTLSNYNGIYDEARNAGLIFTGALTANCTVTTPAVEKLYVISNQTTGGYNVIVSSGSGNTISVAGGTNQLMYCDGTNFNAAITNINNVSGDLTVTGSIFLGGNLTSTTSNLTLVALSNVVNMGSNTGALIAPIGTTAERPTNLVNGMVRWNTTTSAYEVYTGSTWVNLLTANYTVSYLMVGGGGAGGADAGGGGGAGGFLVTTAILTSGTAYTVTVGAGGSNSNGGNSAISTIATAYGGGVGGNGQANGTAGGSGGGGGYGYTAISPSGGAGTSGQGNAGGSSASGYGGAGGGGASAAGSFGGGSNSGGAGGVGTASSISGSSVTYAGGGGGGPSGSGGSGGGANGGSTGNIGGSGSANTGGGGGASGGVYFSGGGAGGSGIVIISYPGTQRGTGGTITTAANNTVHTFTSSGTYTA